MCAQLMLFEYTGAVLADDGRGRIAYTPRFVDAETADAWFTEIRDRVEWRALRRTMYEKEVDVPRLIASYRLDSLHDSVLPELRDAAQRVIDAVGAPFNSIGLNRYRDGRDSVA